MDDAAGAFLTRPRPYLPEADDVGEEQRGAARHDAQAQDDAHHEAEQDVLEHVVLRAQHHGQRQHEQEGAGAAQGAGSLGTSTRNEIET